MLENYRSKRLPLIGDDFKSSMASVFGIKLKIDVVNDNGGVTSHKF